MINSQHDSRAISILIIEDEPFSVEELRRLLAFSGQQFQLMAALDSVGTSVTWLRENPAPDLIFMDVQLADGLSFEIMTQIEIASPVIFTTAYDEYAIKAFQLNSIDYLLKPVEEERLLAALEKFHRLHGPESKTKSPMSVMQIEELQRLIQPKYKQRFVSRIGDQIRHIALVQVAYFFAEEKMVYLVTKEGKRHIMDLNLEHLESVLDPMQFFRLNRKYISQIDSIKGVSRYFKSRLSISLAPDPEEKVLVSREKSADFKRWLEGE